MQVDAQLGALSAVVGAAEEEALQHLCLVSFTEITKRLLDAAIAILANATHNSVGRIELRVNR